MSVMLLKMDTVAIIADKVIQGYKSQRQFRKLSVGNGRFVHYLNEFAFYCTPKTHNIGNLMSLRKMHTFDIRNNYA